MAEYIYFRMKKVEKRQVAQVGRHKIYETDYVLEQTTSSGENTLRVEPSKYLPRGDKFISIENASEQSGLPISELTRLCEKGILYAQSISGTWIIEVESLRNFLKR